MEDFAKDSVNDMVIWRSTGKQLNNIIKQHGHGQLNFKPDSGKIFDGKEIKKTRILNTTDQDTQDTQAAAQPTHREGVSDERLDMFKQFLYEIFTAGHITKPLVFLHYHLTIYRVAHTSLPILIS